MCSYVQLSLEYGKAPPPGQRDPFSESRVGLTGEESHFLHPILRSYEVNPVSEETHRRPWLFVNKTQLSEHPLTNWDRQDYRQQITAVFEEILNRQSRMIQNRKAEAVPGEL